MKDPDAEEASGGATGYWPSAWKQFWYDLLPAKHAPSQSGLRKPKYEQAAWVDSAEADRPEIAAFARRAHENELHRAQTAEEKGSRLAQTCLGLLTLSLALAGYQVSAARLRGGGFLYLLIIPAGLGVLFLVAAAVGALEIDRVGLYLHGNTEELLGDSPTKCEVAVEERGRFLAGWSAVHKYNALLQARAWLSRALVSLLIAGLVAVGMQAIDQSMPTGQPGRPIVGNQPRSPAPPRP